MSIPCEEYPLKSLNEQILIGAMNASIFTDPDQIDKFLRLFGYADGVFLHPQNCIDFDRRGCHPVL